MGLITLLTIQVILCAKKIKKLSLCTHSAPKSIEQYKIWGSFESLSLHQLMYETNGINNTFNHSSDFICENVKKTSLYTHNKIWGNLNHLNNIKMEEVKKKQGFFKCSRSWK